MFRLLNFADNPINIILFTFSFRKFTTAYLQFKNTNSKVYKIVQLNNREQIVTNRNSKHYSYFKWQSYA